MGASLRRAKPLAELARDGLTGQPHVPVLVLGREVICDSARIVEHLRWRDAVARRRQSYRSRALTGLTTSAATHKWSGPLS